MKQRIERFYPLIVFLLAFLLYANTIPNDYNLDDELVTINHRTTSKGFAGISEIFTSFYYEDDMGYKYDYRPITHLTFAIEHEFFGDNPHVSHAINVILYALLSLLIFFLVNRLAPDKGPLLGFIVAVLFAIHPIHTEVVASIKNRDEILSLIFGLVAFFLSLKTNRETSFFKALIWIVIAVAVYGFGIYAKMSSAIILFLIPVYLLIARRFKPRDLVFVFLSSILLSYRLDISILESIVYSILLTTSIAIVYYFLFVFDFRKGQEKSTHFVRSKNGRYAILVFAYIFTIAGFVSNIALLYVLAILIVSLFLFLNVRMGKDNLKFFALSYPAIVLLIFKYNFPFIAFPFFYLLVYFMPFKSKRSFIIPLIVFLLLGIIISMVNDAVLWLAMIPFLFLFIPKAKNILIVIWAFLSLLIVAHVPFLVIIFFLTALTLLLHLLFTSRKQLIFSKIQPHFLFLFIGLSAFNYLNDFSQYVPLDASEDSISQPTEYLNTLFEPKGNIDSKVDRDILFVENPIIENWNLESRVALALNVNSFYLSKLLFPHPLRFYYGYDQFKIYDFKDWQTILSIVLVFLILMLGVYLFIRGRYLSVIALLCLELSILPYSNLLTPVAGIVGERLAFTASFGFSLFIGIYLFQWVQSNKFKLLLIVLTVILTVWCSGFIIYRNTLWKDKLTLFGQDIQHLNRSAQANALLAYEYMKVSTLITKEDQARGYRVKALEYLENAVQIYPDFFNWHFDLGRIYFENKELSKSKNSFEQAIVLDSTYLESFYYLLDIAKINSNWNDGTLYGAKILAAGEQDLYVLMSLSETFYFAEDYLEVLDINDQIIQLDASIPEAYLNKAYAFLKLNEIEKVKEMLDVAERLNPEHGDLLYLRGLVP